MSCTKLHIFDLKQPTAALCIVTAYISRERDDMESDWEGLWERKIRPNMGGSKMTTFFCNLAVYFLQAAGLYENRPSSCSEKRRGGWLGGWKNGTDWVCTYIAKNMVALIYFDTSL